MAWTILDCQIPDRFLKIGPSWKQIVDPRKLWRTAPDCNGDRQEVEPMKETQKEILEEAAVTAVGAGVGGAGGATFGVLEVASTLGTVTGFTAGVVIGAGAVVGAAAFLLGFKAFHHFSKLKQ